MITGSAHAALTWLGTAGETAVETLFPATCPVCGDVLGRHEAGVCRCCWEEMALSLPPGTGWRRVGGRYLETVTALGSYEGKLRMLIHCLKYRKMPGVGGPLGRLVASRARALPDPPDLVVPVPLHWSRRWRRGYNQSAAIAGGAARALGVPVGACLRRVRSTAPQTGRGRRARLSNVRGAFRARGVRMRGASILLVDDVITTGATIRECARALKAAGAIRVHAAAPARTAHLSVTRSPS